MELSSKPVAWRENRRTKQAFVPGYALSTNVRRTACCARAVSVKAVWETPTRQDERSTTAPLISFSRGLVSVALAACLAFNTTVPVFYGDNSAALAVRATRNGGGTFKSASGRVNKDAESLLRWALPVNNKAVRDLQSSLEEITYDIRASKWRNIEGDLSKATTLISKKGDQILGAADPSKRDEAERILAGMQPKFADLKEAIASRNGEETIRIQRDVLRDVGKLELQMVSNFPYEVPAEFERLPKLYGRATVEVSLAKAEGQFDIDGELYDTGKMTMVVDGYSAPITAGNFVDLVKKGFYNNMEISRSDGFVVQTGDPAGDAEGYIDPATEKVRTIPLEIFAQGDPAPTYGVTLEDDGRATEATVLPFTSYGTMGMAREEFTADSASSQFFWFLFEPDLTPAGRNLLDGRYTVFGYVTDGEFFLRDLKAGDFITKAKVVSGLENLSAPKEIIEYKGAELERG